MKSKKSKLVTSCVASPIPTGRKDCGGRRDRQTTVDRWHSCSPTPMGRKDHGGNDPPPRALGVFRHPGTIRRCCSRPLLRCGCQAPGSRDKSLWCLRHPMDDTAPLGKPLPGRGHRRVTISQVFRTQSRPRLARCGHGKATDAFTKHRRRTYRVAQRSEGNR